jgi:hypothetical protein
LGGGGDKGVGKGRATREGGRKHSIRFSEYYRSCH